MSVLFKKEGRYKEILLTLTARSVIISLFHVCVLLLQNRQAWYYVPLLIPSVFLTWYVV